MLGFVDDTARDDKAHIGRSTLGFAMTTSMMTGDLVMSRSGVRFPVPAPTRKHGLTRQNANSAPIPPSAFAAVAVKRDTVVTQARVPVATGGYQ